MAHLDGMLLDKLHEISGHTQLSDLRYTMKKTEVSQLLEKIPFSDYTLEQWSYALTYLSDKAVKVTSEDDVKHMLQSPEW